MKKLFFLLATLLMGVSNVMADIITSLEQIETDKQYIIGNAADRNLYIVLAPGSDSQGGSSNATQASLTSKAGATPFTFTPSSNGFIISTMDGETAKFLGANGGWNVGTTQQTVWTLNKQEEGVYSFNRGGSNNLGTDNVFAGAGIYTDKAVAKNGKWFLEEYEAPAESHDVYAVIDAAAEGIRLFPGEDNDYTGTAIGLEAGEHEVVVTFDGTEVANTTFTSTAKNDKITITYKEGAIYLQNDVVTVTIGEAGYITLYSDKDLNFAYSGAEVYVLSESEVANQLHAERVDNAKAHTGVVIKGEAEATYEFTHLDNNSEAVSVLQGTLEDITANGNELVLGYENEQIGFYAFAGTTLTAGKAYYVAPAGVQAVTINFGTESISLNTVAPVQKGAFDLQGRRVNGQVKGLLILNGKKVIK